MTRLPVHPTALSHVLVSSNIRSGCTITGSDLDTYATYRVQDVQGQITDFQTLILIDALMRLTKSAQRDRVTLNPLADSERLEVVLDGPLGVRTHYLNTMHADEYPDLPKPIPVKDCGPQWLPAYRKATPFASDDETRMVLNGVRMDVEEMGMRMDGSSQGIPRVVTTDGKRLSSLSVPNIPLETSVTLPLIKFLLWNKLEDGCALGVDDTRFQLESGPWTVAGRLIEGQYPRWRQVVPAEAGEDSFTLNEADMPMFKEAIQTLPIRYPESSEAPIILREVRGQLELSALDENGNVTTRVLPTCTLTPGLEVSVNRNKLKEAVDSGFTVWTLSGGMNPLCSRDGDNLHVLMPLRIDGQARVPVPEKPESRTTYPESDQTDTADQTDTTPPETPTEPETHNPETNPEKGKVIQMPKPQTDTENEATEQPELLELAQSARDQAKDLNRTLNDLVKQIKADTRASRALTTELQNAKGILEKLRSIAA